MTKIESYIPTLLQRGADRADSLSHQFILYFDINQGCLVFSEKKLNLEDLWTSFFIGIWKISFHIPFPAHRLLFEEHYYAITKIRPRQVIFLHNCTSLVTSLPFPSDPGTSLALEEPAFEQHRSLWKGNQAYSNFQSIKNHWKLNFPWESLEFKYWEFAYKYMSVLNIHCIENIALVTVQGTTLCPYLERFV